LFRAVIKSVQSVGPDNFLFSVDCTTMPIELQPICKELNRTLQKLKTSFDRLSALNGDLAHEMRTPLHSMQLALECLLDRKNLPPDLEESLIELADTADHMASVLEQMLFLARMEDPSEHLVKQPIDVAELLAMARNPFLALAEERSVRILIQLDGQPHLEGDPALLRQALFNLLGNALRHSPPGGEITLRAHGDSDTTVLEVLDQGHGLPEHIRKNLGQRFLRAESSRERSSGGAGLGLAIVQGIATMHGGRLALEEAAPSGCRATIMFPRN
jgi:two-component system heavy metal sensor histidine kinase CusS